MTTYVIARTARQRPTLMHALSALHGNQPGVTKCGVNTTGWSRAYFNQPIPQVMCLKCKGK